MNVVKPGPVGIVAAAGTGAQEVAILLDRAGVGVSQIIGVGGRDLSADVGGIMFGQAMRMLADDDETETLLLVSKPPSPEAVQKLGEIDVGGKRVVAAFVGWDGAAAPFEIHPTLEAGAFAAAEADPPEFDERARGARARALLRRLARVRGDSRSSGTRRRDLRPRRGGVHAGPPASDGRPRGPQADARRRPTPAASCWTSCSGTARTPIRRASSRPCWRSSDAQVIAHVCGTAGRPAGRAPPGGDAARRRRDRRADERAPPRGPWHEDRDAHVLA